MQAARNLLRSARNGVTKSQMRTCYARFEKVQATPKHYSLLAAPITCFGLGVWQIKRQEQKLEYIRQLKESSESEPIYLPDDLQSIQDAEYLRVKVRGTFDHEHEIYMGPRMEVESKKPGNLVITPFKVEGKKYSILVNRGWVPKTETNPVTRKAGQVKGVVEIRGMVRTAEKKPIGGSDDVRVGDIFSRRDIDSMARLVGAAPVYIDAAAESNVEGGPKGGQTRIHVYNNHFSYIVTWFCLGVFLTLMWVKRYRRPMRVNL